MPQIYDWDRRLYFPSEGRRAEDFFALKVRRLRPGLNPQTWVLKASTLPLDHRSRRKCAICVNNYSFLKYCYMLFRQSHLSCCAAYLHSGRADSICCKATDFNWQASCAAHDIIIKSVFVISVPRHRQQMHGCNTTQCRFSSLHFSQ